jgi:hypothetical protein
VLVDGDTTYRNHHYMTTRHDPGSADADADAAGTGSAGTASAGAKVRAWLADRIPAGWFEAPPDIQVDREEIIIVGTLPNPAAAASPATGAGAPAAASPATGAPAGASAAAASPATGASATGASAAGDSDAERAAAAQDRIRRFREETRGRRIEIAREAEHHFRRKVSWGVVCSPVTEMFTTLSVPVMTRLRQSERRVLDTLVDAGVARSRSDALAWCVRLTGENADAWLSRLRAALRHVEEVRDQGP